MRTEGIADCLAMRGIAHAVYFNIAVCVMIIGISYLPNDLELGDDVKTAIRLCATVAFVQHLNVYVHLRRWVREAPK